MDSNGGPRGNQSLLDAALRYASLGFAVFPLARMRKWPLIPKSRGGNGHLDASTDEQQIRNWWTGCPEANVGIVTDGLAVFDVDPLKGGSAWETAQRLPACPRQQTRSGGHHYVFKQPPARSWRRKIGGVAPGVDVLCDGGYVVAAPSVVHDPGDGITGQYSWDIPLVRRDELPAVPDELAEQVDRVSLVLSVSSPVANGRAVDDAGGIVVDVSRNNRLHSMAAAMRKNGFGQRAIETAMSVVWDEQVVKQTPASGVIAKSELDKAVRSAMRYQIDAPLLATIVNTGRVPSVAVKPDEAADLAWKPFPVSLLPAVLASFVTETAEEMACDPVFVAVPALAAAFGAVGTSRHVVLKRGWTEPAIAWLAVISRSGTLKTPGKKKAIQPAHAIEAELVQEHARQVRLYHLDKAKYDKEARAARKDGKELPSEPRMPLPRQLIVGDITLESLCEILDANPRGLLLSRDELAAWVGSFTRYRKGAVETSDLAAWLSIHSGDALRVNRKTGSKPSIYVPHAAVSLIGSIQPGVLARCLASAAFFDAGLVARRLLVMPPPQPKRWTDKEVTRETVAAYGKLIRGLWDLEMDVGEDGPEPLLVRLTPEAKELWVAFYNEWATEQIVAGDDLAAAFAKLEAYCPRLALVYHLAGQVSSGEDDCDPIQPGTMAAAIETTRWFGNEAQRIYTYLGQSEQARKAESLMDLIRRRGGRISVRELQRTCRTVYATAPEAEAALQALVPEIGAWEPTPLGELGGRPTKQFVLHVRDKTTKPTKPWTGV
jgi:hypothetical protein